MDEAGWQEWTSELGPAFQDMLAARCGSRSCDEAKFAQNEEALEVNKWAFAAIAPRGIGPTRWSHEAGKPAD